MPLEQAPLYVQPRKVKWGGPFSWPGFEKQTGLPPIPSVAGVYLMTFQYRKGYLIYAAGITRRPIPQRFREHSRGYREGKYTVLALGDAQLGIRREIWHGWGYARRHPEEFEKRKDEILKAVETQLGGFRIFIADFGKEARIHERVESAIMKNLYLQEPPFCDIPDKGMQLAGRWETEGLIQIENNLEVRLYGLPERLDV